MDKPRVSVIIPCYNQADTICAALHSVMAQDFLDWECIVVDDGSHQPIRPILDQMSDSRIVLVESPQNVGRGRARQLGLEAARGSFVAFVDADDAILPTKLSEQVAFLDRNPNCYLVGTGMIVVTPGGMYETSPASSPPRRLRHPFESLELAAATVCMRREVADSVAYRGGLRDAEDWDFLVRAAMEFPYANLSKPLYIYRRDGIFSWVRLFQKRIWQMRAVAAYLRQYPALASRDLAVQCLKLGFLLCECLMGSRESALRRSAATCHSRVEEEIRQYLLGLGCEGRRPGLAG